jgi:alkylation response protein AidB-like acyl-CoA dehydrogenase
MDFTVPERISTLLADLDGFIEAEIVPLQAQDDNERFFDHRREWARTDFDAGGLPRQDWEELLAEMRRRADRAGFLRFALPEELGGQNGSNLEMAFVRQHLAGRGLGLHNDLQNESSIVGNFPIVLLALSFGTAEQRERFCEPLITGERRCGFGLSEPAHGSDATWMDTTARRDGSDWVINGAKRWNSGIHYATHDLVFARTSGSGGDARGITAFLVPMDTPGVRIVSYMWTFNMPTDHGDVSFSDVRVPDSTVLGEEGGGLAVAQLFVHENRIRQAASSLGAAQYCIGEAVRYARERVTFGQPLARRQAIQWPLAELHTESQMLQALIRETAWSLDRAQGDKPRRAALSERIAMCNYRANRLVCDAADQAMQVHGGLGYSRHTPFEHIYRHHRRYRITEGSDEIQIRRVAGHLFGFMG